jgi:hypothetical protein
VNVNIYEEKEGCEEENLECETTSISPPLPFLLVISLFEAKVPTCWNFTVIILEKVLTFIIIMASFLCNIVFIIIACVLVCLINLIFYSFWTFIIEI